MSFRVRVSLNGLRREVNRTFIVNDKMKIKDFCEAIIVSMNGYLEHLYTLNYGDICFVCPEMEPEEYGDRKMGNKTLQSLQIVPKDKMLLTYDFGDGWEFIISFQKVVEENKNKITLVNGKGYGIVEDIGGIYTLYDCYYGHTDEYGEYIEEFLEGINLQEFEKEYCEEVLKKYN